MTEPSSGSKPKRPVVVPAIALVMATALGITALMDGFDEAPKEEPKILAEGGKIDQTLYETEFLGAKVTFQKAPNEFAKDHRYLDIMLKVTNKGTATTWTGMPWAGSDKSGSGYGESLIVKEPVLTTSPTLEVASEQRSTLLHPGVPTQVLLRYELDLKAKAPEQVVISVAGFEETEDEYDGTTRWEAAGEKVTKPDPLTMEGLTAPMTGDDRPRAYNMIKAIAKVTLTVKPQEAS
ncbi:hypothetical protein ACIBH1_00270 [Nonomuraea sp. NPDC050663]|uniref:hypothetical protein n=1 Tax=Nonomuraea sp. NPDC050663 TaxID=3364370 RepID=UPI0037AA5422